MIDHISTTDLQRLAEADSPNCVSIYLPTHQAGEQTVQDPIRFKNLLALARNELEALGMKTREVDDLLSPLTTLHDDRDFWANMDKGLAVFVNDDGIQTYRLSHECVELAVVAERFHLKPLLPSITTDDVFYVLALSQNEVRLLRGNRLSVSQLALGEIPASFAEAFRLDDREAQLQSHAGNLAGGGSVVAVFHGQTSREDTKTVDAGRFLTAVDSGFREIVGNVKAPLVLAGVDSIVSHYRKLSRYSHIIDGDVSGNPDRISPHELHDRAWQLVEPLFDAEQHTASAAIVSGSLPTLGSLAEVVVAADDGRVESLFVPLGVQRWGAFDADRRIAEEHDTRLPGDRDLFDIAAIKTLGHGGSVFVVPELDIPGGTAVAATLRY
jgi:hypothetical protein